jgi:tRNA isopentenyl-2-thiomethyl-A-37 hydroxylase MiaE
MRERRAVSWLLNWYRQSELEGALLLGRMVRHADDPKVIAELTRHAADEARHAWLWQRTIAQLDLAPVRIFRSYQSFYAADGVLPQRLAEVLALTHVFERRVDEEFGEQLTDPTLPDAAVRTFKALLRDEQRHLSWIGAWLQERPELQPLVQQYSDVDRRVSERLRPFRDRLWDVPGLGEEVEDTCSQPCSR